jgi:hypothetical protein
MFDDDEEDFFSEFAIRSKNITSVKNLILRRDYVPKVVNYMTEVIEQMGIPEHIDDFKAHYRMSRDTFYIVLENIQDTLIRNGMSQLFGFTHVNEGDWPYISCLPVM